jgi:hypothetical protein
MRMNLLPPATRIRHAMRRQLQRWVCVWILGVVAGALYCVPAIQQVLHWRQRLAEIEPLAAETRQVVARTTQIEQELRVAARQTSTIEQLQPADHSLPLLSMLTGGVMESDQAIQIQRFSMHSERVSPAAQKTQQEQGDPWAHREVKTVASIHGIALHDQAVSRFIEHLRAYGLFRQVHLKSTSVLTSVVGEGREFHLECHY